MSFKYDDNMNEMREYFETTNIFKKLKKKKKKKIKTNLGIIREN
jgi:hypothetical protein